MKALSPGEEEEEREEEEEEEEEEDLVAEKIGDKDEKEHATLRKTNVDNLELSQDSPSSGRTELEPAQSKGEKGEWGKYTPSVF